MLRGLLSLVLIGGSFGCTANRQEDGSELNQIVRPGNVDCPDVASRKGLVAQLYGSRVFGAESNRQSAISTMTRLPKAYLDFVFVKAKARMNANGPGQGGLTSWTNDGQGRLPTTVSTGTKGGLWNVVNHEMGHASYGAIQRQFSDFETELTKTFNYAVLQNKERGNMQGYAQNNREEFFAELFDEFYCGTVARERFAQKLPVTYAFAEKYLIPVTDDMGFDPNADTDGDGILDTADKCPGSKPDPTSKKFDTPATRVWNVANFEEGTENHSYTVKYNGCQSGQSL